MTLPGRLDLHDWFERTVTTFLVLTPTSTSPQPVHVLNGLFHTMISGKRAPRAAIDLVAAKGGGEWAVGNDGLRAKSPLQLPADDLKLEKARYAVGALVAADRAVFAQFASFQIAHVGLTTSDTTHHHLGELAARLTLRSDAGRVVAQGLIDRLRTPQPNPHWALQSALIEPQVSDEWVIEEPVPTDWWGRDPRCASLADALSDALVRAVDLAATSIDSLIGLQTLAVMATWVNLIAYAQVPQLCHSGSLADLLAEAGEPGSLWTVRAASAATLDSLDGAFQEWMCGLLECELDEFFGTAAIDDAKALTFLDQTLPKKKLSGGVIRTSGELHAIFQMWRSDHETRAALARTLQDFLTDAMGNKAKEWFAAVGRHCGFVGPRRGHPARLRVEVALAPALLLAGLDAHDSEVIPFAVWLDRMATRYGLLFDPNSKTRSMTPRASEEDLRRNESDVASLFASLGLARRYSDGLTELLNPFYVWTKK